MKLNLEKRGEKRYVTNELKNGNKTLSFEIGYHYVLKKYYVEVAVTYLNRRIPETFGKIIFYGKNINECTDFIEKNYNVKLTIL